MTKLKITVLVFFTFALIAAFQLNTNLDTTIWIEFVNDPSPMNYFICVNQIETQFPVQKFVNDNGDILNPFWHSFDEKLIFAKLLKLLDNGNELATDLCFRLYPYLGSGEPSELVTIRLGNVIDRDPNLFFTLYTIYFPDDTTKERIWRKLDFFVLSLDERDELTRQSFQGQVQKYDSRINILEMKTSSRYSSLKDLSIEIIKEEELEISNMLKEDPNAEP